MAAARAALSGANLIAGELRADNRSTFAAVNPRTGKPTGPRFSEASPDDVRAAAHAAATAFDETADWPGGRRADLLEAAAGRLEALGEALIEVADSETGLGAERLASERDRTTGQLRTLAALAREGSYVDAIITTAAEGRPDLRRMLVPIGPVAVFGASNFPIAFSVPGGDSASALAVGCPVLAKAHPSHPGTSELCGRAIAEAVADVGGPAGMFSLVHGTGPDVGAALVRDPDVAAVAFTGSLRGGRALYDLAAQRPDPIPVYAEMGSLNPLAITPGALRERPAEIATGLAASFTQGTGQFCTKPGLVLLPDCAEVEPFLDALRAAVRAATPGVLLNPAIHDAFAADIVRLLREAPVTVVAEGDDRIEAGFAAAPRVLLTDVEGLSRAPALLEEHFGPVTILVRCDDVAAMIEAVDHVPGGLTGTIHLSPDEADAPEIAALLRALRARAGRIIVNGFPTGVAVTHAQHHGGPYPATTAPGHTSVGSTAVRRFLRPVVYQNAPAGLLPPALRDENPLGVVRWIDGEPTRGPVP